MIVFFILFCIVCQTSCFLNKNINGNKNLSSCESGISTENGQTSLQIRFPRAIVSQNDQYLCTAYRIPFDEEVSITQFIPNATMNTSHHMLVYGCSVSGIHHEQDGYWNCGNMGNICKGKKSILYAWARNAPKFMLPPKIGFRVSGDTGIDYLVVQIHYVDKMSPGTYDCSGVSAVLEKKKTLYPAGIFLLGSPSLDIPPMSSYHADISCLCRTKSPIHVFAFRTHAHSLGTVITAYRVRNNKAVMIGKGNPMWPHAFYLRVGGSIEIRPEDGLIARCVYHSNRITHTYVGMGGQDEMCNFYMMYYTKDNVKKTDFQCWGNNSPNLLNFFPITANALAPYPGFAGHDSILAINQGRAAVPPVPDEHHHNHEKNSISKKESNSSFLKNSTSAKNQGQSSVPDEHQHNHEKNSILEKGSNSSFLKSQLVHDSSWSFPGLSELGQVGGVAVDKSGMLHIFHRADRLWDQNSFSGNIFKGSSGPILRNTILSVRPDNHSVSNQWGSGLFFMPHGISIDIHNNVWLTDVAMHQVLKFPPGGSTKPLLILGRKMIPGNDQKHFCKPADVAVDETGFIYVADGYCNSRIVKFDIDGQFIKSWKISKSLTGSPFYPVPPIIPHSITLIGRNQHICVADRENGKIQCFDKEGVFVKLIENRHQMGPNIYAITYSNIRNGILYAVNGEPAEGGRTCGYTIDYESGNVIGEWCPFVSQQLTRPHDVTAINETVYVGQLDGLKVLRFVLSSTKPHTTQLQSTGSFNLIGATKSTILDYKKQVKEDGVLVFLAGIGLLVLALLTVIIACCLIRSRKRRFHQYQDLIGLKKSRSFDKSGRQSYVRKWRDQKGGFSRLPEDDFNEDDVMESEEEAASVMY